jgi:uncharacterized protein YktB (UPF0637 family)
MTIKKPAVKTTVKSFNAVATAKLAADCNAKAGTFSALANDHAQAIHKYVKKAGIVVGTMKSDCAIMAAFVSTAEKTAKNAKVLENLCSTFRKACNTGSPFSHNPSRDAKKKGAKTSKSAETVAVVKLTIVKDSGIDEVAQGLREALEGKREQYAELVAFLVDALDEFEGV